jgi:hypothetical protein
MDPPQEIVEGVFGERVPLVQEIEIGRVDGGDQLADQPDSRAVGEGLALGVSNFLLLRLVLLHLRDIGGLVVDLRQGRRGGG